MPMPKRPKAPETPHLSQGTQDAIRMMLKKSYFLVGLSAIACLSIIYNQQHSQNLSKAAQ